jgi:hypothetical protein
MTSMNRKYMIQSLVSLAVAMIIQATLKTYTLWLMGYWFPRSARFEITATDLTFGTALAFTAAYVSAIPSKMQFVSWSMLCLVFLLILRVPVWANKYAVGTFISPTMDATISTLCFLVCLSICRYWSGKTQDA